MNGDCAPKFQAAIAFVRLQRRKAVMTVAEEMRALLTEAFAPTRLNIINDSAKHSGHMGDDGSGESHFTIEIESAAFAALNRLARQRAVIAALGDIVGQRVHAVAIKASVPEA
jgi:BolA family transcriptional regulator, general stress-responsive regulator